MSFLPIGASNDGRNQSKHAVTEWNQILLLITIRFGGHKRVFGKFLSDFWRTSPRIDELATNVD